MSEIPENHSTISDLPPIAGVISGAEWHVLAAAESHDAPEVLAILHTLGEGAVRGSFDGTIAVYADTDTQGNDTFGYLDLSSGKLGDRLSERTVASLGLAPAVDSFNVLTNSQPDEADPEIGVSGIPEENTKEAEVESIRTFTVNTQDINFMNGVQNDLQDALRRGDTNKYINDSSILTVISTLHKKGQLTDAGLLAASGQILSAAVVGMRIENKALDIIQTSHALSLEQQAVIKEIANNLSQWKYDGISGTDISVRLGSVIDAHVHTAEGDPKPSEAYITTLLALNAGVNPRGIDQLTSYMDRFRLK
jgi:hypothetical protein